jgi:hypothetical protein
LTHRWVRLGLVLLALVATAGLAYRAYQDELALQHSAERSRQAIDLADRALVTTADLRAAFHGYVAPGQSSAFWVPRSAVLMDELQAALGELGSTQGSGAPLASESMTRLIAADKRARAFVRDNQELLGADIVFTEIRDHLEAIRLQVTSVRDSEVGAAATREGVLRREQYFLLGGMLGLWLLCALMLLPVADVPVPVPMPVRTKPDVDDIPLIAPPPVEAAQPVVPPPAPVIVKTAPAPPVPRLPEAAQLCVDLARASDGDQIASLLTRAADVLDATGLIVWVTSPDGKSLVPAASCGYDERMLARVGALPIDAQNLTAAAFRDGARRTTSAHSDAPAAIAAPLVGPNGAVGVLSGEVRHVERVGETTSALASIFAAQLATLVGSMPPAEAIESTTDDVSSEQGTGSPDHQLAK